MDLDTIHDSLVNGQRKQMVKQIDDCVLYDFWNDYADYLKALYVDKSVDKSSAYDYFKDAVVSYFRIKNR